MDCQSCTYSKLDSLDPEDYRKQDDSDHLRIHIESKPLLDEPKRFSVSKSVKKTKKKKRVLSTLDIFISIFVVTPCVVGCWRGIWQIMDIYAVYFPVWESFIIGMVTHIVLALGQDVFHYVVVEKQRKSWLLRIFNVFLMKFYITTFNITTNMVWRAGWIIFDRFCQLQTSSSATVLWEGSSNTIWFTIVCILILFCLKGLKNTLSPPFSIALDNKDEVFLFSTRYIYKIAYTIAILIIRKTTTASKDRIGIAEKLTSSSTYVMENIKKRFTKTLNRSITSRVYTHHLSSNRTFPKIDNIRCHPRIWRNNKQQIKRGLGRIFNSSGGFVNSDPFHSYKPSDPSEINLLATASFRFAPPVWKNFQKLYQNSQQPTQPQHHMTPPNIQQVENTNIQETVRNFAKPFVVTLNIYPMKNDGSSGLYGQNRYGQRLLSQRIQGDFPYKAQGDSTTRYGKTDKMTIQLNVFPETFLSLQSQDRERHEESTVNKVKFV
ncbi:hypothetical protein NQ318_009691 [Aromia moschata]|uniref:Uncharacterized protein n=1 Tax=Aromia moschata TaxID=1265417 RepID=A0AAV8Y2W3_9CUCU|nr:hypothetical protein NQ318_009691 [Aromia moschata]